MKITVTLKRGLAGKRQQIKDTVRSLGLKKINQQKIVEDNAVIRGMLAKVSHLVHISEEK